MGIAAFFRGFSAAENAKIEDLASPLEQRLHPRYSFSFLKRATIKFENGAVGQLRDLSYSGVGAQFGSEREISRLSGEAKFTISVLGKGAPARGRRVFQSKNLAGFSFIHADASTLIFLREILESCRCGSTLMPISKEVVHERFKGKAWEVFRGDGPSDIVLEKDENGKVKNFLFTFLNDKKYSHLRLEGAVLKTGISPDTPSDPLGIPTYSVIESALADPDTIRKTVFHLMGFNPAYSTPAIDEACEMLLAKM